MFLTLFYSKIYDFSLPWQCLFQEPATTIMENIIDLQHHDIIFNFFFSFFSFQKLVKIVKKFQTFIKDLSLFNKYFYLLFCYFFSSVYIYIYYNNLFTNETFLVRFFFMNVTFVLLFYIPSYKIDGKTIIEIHQHAEQFLRKNWRWYWVSRINFLINQITCYLLFGLHYKYALFIYLPTIFILLFLLIWEIRLTKKINTAPTSRQLITIYGTKILVLAASAINGGLGYNYARSEWNIKDPNSPIGQSHINWYTRKDNTGLGEARKIVDKFLKWNSKGP